jgi:predicted Zn-dependent peptidase
MIRRIATFALIAALNLAALPALAAPAAPAAKAAAIPPRPEQLAYGPLRFEVPDAASYRHELPGGVVAYVVPDHSLPLVKVTLYLRTGAFRERADRPGVASLTAAMMRQGGTERMTPEEFDQRADFLAANLSASSSPTGATAGLDVLSTALDDGLALLLDMVRRPRFDEARLAVEKGKILEAMKQRNDDAGDILDREWDWLMYGRDHYSSHRLTEAELGAITRQDLVDFHRRTFGTEGLVVAVSGDVEPEAILSKLADGLAGWNAGEPSPWPPRGPGFEPEPGLYHVEKDIPQGKVAIGHRSVQWQRFDDPEMYALMVMNDIYGGHGFTARLMKRVRSDEGLAYGAYSTYDLGYYWPTAFDIGFASKNETVAFASAIALEELDKMRTAPVTPEELQVSKASFVDSFPRSFESPARVARLFATDEVLGRPHDYWTHFRDRIRAVTAGEVQAAAQKYLHPDRLVMLVVGKWSDIEPGDPQGRAKMSQLFGGRVTHLPLRDPLTLEPMR